MGINAMPRARALSFCAKFLFISYLEVTIAQVPFDHKHSAAGQYCTLEFFPRAVPDQRQCRPRFSNSGSNLTIFLYEGSIFISTFLRGTNSSIVPSYEGTNSSTVPSYEGTAGRFYRLHWRACAEAIAVDVKDFEIFCCPHFKKKR